MRRCLPGSLFSAGTPFGCVEFSLPRLKSVNQLLEVRVLLLFNSEVLQSRDLIFFVQTYSASVNDHQSWAALLQQFFPSWSNSFSNRNFSYCSWLYLYSISPFPLTFGCFIRGLCLSETFPLLENSAISPFSLIFPNSWSLIWMWLIFFVVFLSSLESFGISRVENPQGWIQYSQSEFQLESRDGFRHLSTTGREFTSQLKLGSSSIFFSD